MAEAIAIVGIAAVLLGLGFQGATYLRDRPRLRVDYSAAFTLDSPAVIRVIANNGPQPVTITRAGLLVDAEIAISKPGAPEIPGKFRIDLDEGQHRPLASGATTEYSLPLTKWPGPLIHADFPLRPFVVDSRKKTHWAGAAPILRILLNKGWEPPPDTPAQMLEPITEPIRVTPVEPRWKVWKPKGQRKSRTYVPEIRPRRQVRSTESR